MIILSPTVISWINHIIIFAVSGSVNLEWSNALEQRSHAAGTWATTQPDDERSGWNSNLLISEEPVEHFMHFCGSVSGVGFISSGHQPSILALMLKLCTITEIWQLGQVDGVFSRWTGVAGCN